MAIVLLHLSSLLNDFSQFLRLQREDKNCEVIPFLTKYRMRQRWLKNKKWSYIDFLLSLKILNLRSSSPTLSWPQWLPLLWYLRDSHCESSGTQYSPFILLFRFSYISLISPTRLEASKAQKGTLNSIQTRVFKHFKASYPLPKNNMCNTEWTLLVGARAAGPKVPSPLGSYREPLPFISVPELDRLNLIGKEKD